jgi:serine protease Do
LWRERAVKELTVVLGDAAADKAVKSPPGKEAEPEKLGMTMRELSRDEQRMLKTEAAIVVETATGIAAKSGIQAGDLLVAINSKRVANIKQLLDALDRAGKRAAVLVQRGGNLTFIPLRF